MARKILIADDEAAIRYSLSKFLTNEGFEVDAVADFASAVFKVKSGVHYDVIISDILLEDATGVDFLRTIKELKIANPVIMITGKPDLNNATESVRYGAYDFLVKPILKDDFIHAVKRAVAYTELLEENENYKRKLEELVAERTKKLKELKEFNESVIQYANDGIMVINKDGKIALVNPAMCEMSGFTEEQLLTQDGYFMVHPDDVRLVEEYGRLRSQNIPAPAKYELRLINAKNEIRNILVSVRKMKYPEGALVVIISDITELKKTEQELRASRDELETAYRDLKKFDAVKTQFIDTASHELRTPLTVIKANLDLIRRGGLGELNPTLEDAIGSVWNNTLGMIAIVEQMLEVIRIQSQDFVLSCDFLKVKDFIQNKLKRLDTKGKDLEFDIDIMDDLTIWADRYYLGYILENILSNAIKYSYKGGKIVISSVKDDTNNHEVLYIRDYGIGIPNEHIGHIFEKFYRAHTYKEGTGLGLYIVKGLMDAHGGKIWVDSEEGKGATFYVSFPAQTLVAISIVSITCCDKPPKNFAPEITNIEALPMVINKQAFTTLTVSAKDDDKDPLYYKWIQPQGDFPHGTNKATVIWQSPNVEGFYPCSVMVTDMIDTVYGVVQVEVSSAVGGDLYHDELTDISNWTSANGDFSSDSNGTCLTRVKDPNAFAGLRRSFPFKNFTVELSLNVGDDAAGLVFEFNPYSPLMGDDELYAALRILFTADGRAIIHLYNLGTVDKPQQGWTLLSETTYNPVDELAKVRIYFSKEQLYVEYNDDDVFNLSFRTIYCEYMQLLGGSPGACFSKIDVYSLDPNSREVNIYYQSDYDDEDDIDSWESVANGTWKVQQGELCFTTIPGADIVGIFKHRFDHIGFEIETVAQLGDSTVNCFFAWVFDLPDYAYITDEAQVIYRAIRVTFYGDGLVLVGLERAEDGSVLWLNQIRAAIFNKGKENKYQIQSNESGLNIYVNDVGPFNIQFPLLLVQYISLATNQHNTCFDYMYITQ